MRAEVIVMNEIIETVDIIVGMDVIGQLEGFTIYENGIMEFRGVHCEVNMQPTVMTCKSSRTSLCKIKDRDFNVSFDGKRWTVVWNWTIGLPILKNKVVMKLIWRRRRKG